MIYVFDDIFLNRKMYYFVYYCIDNFMYKMDIFINGVYVYV